MATRTPHITAARWAVVLAAAAAAVLLAPSTVAPGERPAIRVWTFSYVSHDGTERSAVLVLPAWYGPRRNPSLPLVISPHGRAGTGRSNARYWGSTPALGRFALVSPDGMGRRFPLHSYGYMGQIDDLAEMPAHARRAFPWLRIDRTRIYALGSSMGGQETLLLVARHPRLLAGAAAMDSVTDLARRYRQLPGLACGAACRRKWIIPYGVVLQRTMRREIGGTPEQAPARYAARSPQALAGRIARSGVPLQVWWSTRDRIVFDQQHQSRALVDALRRLGRCVPVSAYVGRWRHSHEMRSEALLPVALAGFGLLPDVTPLPAAVRYERPACASNL